MTAMMGRHMPLLFAISLLWNSYAVGARPRGDNMLLVPATPRRDADETLYAEPPTAPPALELDPPVITEEHAHSDVKFDASLTGGVSAMTWQNSDNEGSGVKEGVLPVFNGSFVRLPADFASSTGSSQEDKTEKAAAIEHAGNGQATGPLEQPAHLHRGGARGMRLIPADARAGRGLSYVETMGWVVAAAAFCAVAVILALSYFVQKQSQRGEEAPSGGAQAPPEPEAPLGTILVQACACRRSLHEGAYRLGPASRQEPLYPPS